MPRLTHWGKWNDISKNTVSASKEEDNLLPCPECGNQPNLVSQEPEYQSMKFFCGAHASCGDWKKTKELAAEDWNKRVEEYKTAVQWNNAKELNNISNLEIIEQGRIKTSICCHECDYNTGFMEQRDAVFRVNMHGGYFMFDGEGGSDSKCPKCGGYGLHVEN